MPGSGLRVPLIGTMSWRRFETLSLGVPIGGVLLVMLYVLLSPWPHTHLGRVLVSGSVSLAGTLAFGLLFLAAVRAARHELEEAVGSERSQRMQLGALHEAALAITQDLNLHTILGRVVDLSREVVACRFAAMRVLENHELGTFLTSGLTSAEMEALGPLPKGLGVLGVVASSPVSVRLERIQAHPASVGFPPGHPPMTTLLGTPVRFRDQTFGYIYLSEKLDGTTFTAEDERTVERFAAHAAAAIANAHLLAEVGRLGTLAERERIGRELHDGTLQELYAIALGLQAALPIDGGDASAAVDGLGEATTAAVEALSKVMANIRRYVFGHADGPMREPVDLTASLGELVANLGASRTPRVDSALTLPSPFWISPEAAHEVSQVVREALTNAVRHAKATAVSLRAELGAGGLHVAVRDNGVGFRTRGGAVGHGLENMRLRAANLGGVLRLESHPGHGTEVRLSVPTERLSVDGKE